MLAPPKARCGARAVLLRRSCVGPTQAIHRRRGFPVAVRLLCNSSRLRCERLLALRRTAFRCARKLLRAGRVNSLAPTTVRSNHRRIAAPRQVANSSRDSRRLRIDHARGHLLPVIEGSCLRREARPCRNRSRSQSSNSFKPATTLASRSSERLAFCEALRASVASSGGSSAFFAASLLRCACWSRFASHSAAQAGTVVAVLSPGWFATRRNKPSRVLARKLPARTTALERRLV